MFMFNNGTNSTKLTIYKNDVVEMDLRYSIADKKVLSIVWESRPLLPFAILLFTIPNDRKTCDTIA